MSLKEECKFCIFPWGPESQEETERRREFEIRTRNILADYLAGLYFLIIGAVYANKCPLEELIPVWFMGSGGILITLGTFRIIVRICCPRDRKPLLQHLVIIVFIGLLVLWSIFGSWLVYKEFEPNTNPQLGDYCDISLYYPAFLIVSAMNITLAFILIINCILWTAIASGLKSNA